MGFHLGQIAGAGILCQLRLECSRLLKTDCECARQEAKQKGREEAAEYLRDNQHIQGGPYDTQNPNANQSYQYQDYQNQTYQAHDPNAYGYQTQWQPGPGPAGPSGPPATALGMAAVAPSGMDGEIILEEVGSKFLGSLSRLRECIVHSLRGLEYRLSSC